MLKWLSALFTKKSPPVKVTIPTPIICGHVRVIKVPEGDAPEWVRQEWVGLILPESYVSPGDRAFNGMFGVGGGDLETGDKSVYISFKNAMEILSFKSPEAASWWLNHNSDGQGLNLRFSPSEVERLS